MPAQSSPDRLAEWERIKADPLYRELKLRTRRITIPLLLAFVLIYGTYVGTSVYASDAVANHYIGPLSFAWVLTFVATAMPIVIAVIFMSYSDRVIEPINEQLRARAKLGETP